MSRKKWIVNNCDKEVATLIAEELNLSPYAALIASARGVKTVEDAEEFYCNVTSDNKALPSNRYGKLNKLDIGPQIAIGEVYDKFFIELSYKYGLLGCYKGIDWYNHNSILFSIGFYW